MSDSQSERHVERDRSVCEENVRVVRLGHGANCSSIGSVVDTLFATAVVGGAIFCAIAAAMSKGEVQVVTPAQDEPREKDATPEKDDAPKETSDSDAEPS